MSQQPIAHSADLRRLRDEGYTIRIVAGYLVVDDIPFVDDKGAVHGDGSLVMALTTGGRATTQPSDHTSWFCGGVPCNKDRRPLAHIINNTRRHDVGHGLVASCYLSAKPKTDGGRYRDYHHKVATYVGHIVGPAQAVDAAATARRYRPAPSAEPAVDPFRFADTASSRAGIVTLNDSFVNETVGIVGLGGSGEFLFDAVAKTPVPAIHIFDADEFLTHNAFRAPGAPTHEQLDARPLKVDYFGDIYTNMHRGIHRHPFEVTEDNVEELADLTFVFIAIDDAEAKAPIIRYLVDAGIAFIDIGMGVQVIDDRLTGSLRTTLVTPTQNHHAAERIPTVSTRREEDAYRSNIQIAELNMLNAALAVVAWKRYRHFYADLDSAHHSMFSIASNRIANDEFADDAADAEDEAA